MMKIPRRSRMTLSTVLLTLPVVALAACGSGSSSADNAPGGGAASSGGGAASSKPTLTIGVVGPLTGDFAIVGTSDLQGAKLASKEFQSSATIKVVAEDDASQCPQSVNATVKLITQTNVSAVLGAGNSPCALAMVPVTEQYKTPQFTVGVGNDITTQGSKYIFRVAPSGDQQTKDLAQYAVKTMGLSRIGVMFTNDEYGRSGGEGMKAGLKALGLTPALYETWTAGTKDFSAQISKMKSSKVQALYTSGNITDQAVLAKQLSESGANVKMLGDTGIANTTYLKLAGEASDGTVVPVPFQPQSARPNVKKFVSKYKAAYHRLPNSWDAEMYDAVGMLVAAARATHSTSGEELRNYVASKYNSQKSAYHGIMGDIYFDEKGNSYFPIEFSVAKAGEFVPAPQSK